MSNKKNSLGNPKLQSKIFEINLPQNIMELFDETKRMGFETPDEIEYQEKKKEYNEQIIEEIKGVYKNELSKREREVFDLMFQDGLTLTEAATKLDIRPQSVLKMKSRFIAKIKKQVTYKFDLVTDFGFQRRLKTPI